MKKDVVTVKNNKNLILDEISKNTPLIIVRKYFKTKICKKIIDLCEKNSSLKNHRKLRFNKFFNLFTLDVMPQKVKTNRIFRRWELTKYTANKFKEIKILASFHNKIIINNSNKKINRRVAVMHYPCGGGFFDWHKHNRYPSNYAIIVTLTKKGKNFKKGDANFKIGKKIIDLEKFNISIGDLILFRYDLLHSISSVDPNKNMTFDKNGRWSLVMFIPEESDSKRL